jgi:TPR repeat protein
MKKLLAVLAVVILTAICSPAVAGEQGEQSRKIMVDKYLQGAQLYESNSPKAYDVLKPVAEAGNPNAQYLLGTLYDFGRGVETDHEEANRWYLKAAEQGQDDAQYNLAISYERGEGIAQNDRQAIYWLGQSAARGDGQALEVLKNYAKRSADARYALAQVYRNGVKLHNNQDLYPDEADDEAIAPDKDTYLYWLQQAVKLGSTKAAQELDAQTGK